MKQLLPFCSTRQYFKSCKGLIMCQNQRHLFKFKEITAATQSINKIIPVSIALDENSDDQNDIQCPKCSEQFSNLVNLGIHLNNTHGRINKRFQCPSCTKTHPSSTKLRMHIETVHMKRKTKCDLCDSIVAYHGLRNHMRVSHGGDRVNKPYKCDMCEFSSHADKYVKAHILNCHKKDEYLHACDQCDKKFAYPHLLSEHIEAVHEGIKRFMCDKCGKGFPKRLKSLFDEHVQRGDCLAPKKYASPEIIKCPCCDMTFTAMCNYIQHFRYIHGSAPPSIERYMCDKCGKGFSKKQKSLFDEHVAKGQLISECLLGVIDFQNYKRKI